MSETKKDKLSQSDRFIQTAREIGADENSSAADALMGRLARTPPQPKSKRNTTAEERSGPEDGNQ